MGKKIKKFAFFWGLPVALLLAPPHFKPFFKPLMAFGGEYTAGLRYAQDLYSIFGRVGAHPAFYAMPFVPEQNYGVGFELFGEAALTREFFLEPFFGMLWQNRMIKYPGLETNINGISTFANNIYDNWQESSLSFGLSVKGKSPGLSRMFRVFAVYGIQFTYSYDVARLQHETSLEAQADGSLKESEGLEPEAVGFCSDSRLDAKRNGECNVSPWGFRMHGGIGLEFFHPSLQGVVLQADLRLGFDMSQALFGRVLINEKNLSTSYFEITTNIHLAVLYRLPLGRVKEMQQPKKKDRRENLNED